MGNRKVNPDCPDCRTNRRVIFMRIKVFIYLMQKFQCEIYKCNSCGFILDPYEAHLKLKERAILDATEKRETEKRENCTTAINLHEWLTGKAK
jgi:rubredoxin